MIALFLRAKQLFHCGPSLQFIPMSSIVRGLFIFLCWVDKRYSHMRWFSIIAQIQKQYNVYGI